MDNDLLTEARQAQERLIDAERDADVARADFHRAVRRLHLHGASLRELADALGLSHQRVHQIVEAAGGSRRWLRNREHGLRESRPAPQAACTFCGRDRSQGAKLIAGPHVYICDSCVGHARSMIDSGGAADDLFARVVVMPERGRPERGQQVRLACSFCGKQSHQVAGMATSSAGILASSARSGRPTVSAVPSVCTECLDLCDEILAENLPETPDPG